MELEAMQRRHREEVEALCRQLSASAYHTRGPPPTALYYPQPIYPGHYTLPCKV